MIPPSNANDLLEQIKALRLQHSELDERISYLAISPPDDQLEIRRLKKRKLALKDNIAALERQLEPDEYA